jgi:hypothetical protein
MRRQSSKSAKRKSSCPDESVLAAYSDGLLEDAERQQAEEHFADCDDCLEQIGLLAQLSRQADDLRPVPDELLAKAQALSTRPSSRLTTAYWVPAAAAALLLLAILPWMALRTDAPPQDRLLRSSQGQSALQVVAPQPETNLSLPFEFAWKILPQAVSYEVLVVDSEGEPVWQGQASQPQITLPADAPLKPGNRYFMRVGAQIAGGEEAFSDFTAFTVRKAP